jgi:hypothetical protein
MKSTLVRISAILSLVILVCAGIMSSGCSANKQEGFAIYLTKSDVPPTQMAVLSHIEIAAQPVIALKDISAYDPDTHEITLTAEALGRLSSLQIPVEGKSFVVCVDKKLIYWGAFWTPISSISFDGVTIWKPLGQDSNIIKLELGYPAPSFYNGEDPRNNSLIMDSLKQAGKLSSLPPAVNVDSLPRSMKGYELYSWQADGQWHYTLITGTNRNKTTEEIISIVNTVKGDELIHLHVVGTEALKTILSKIPQGEYVSWQGGAGIAATPPVNIKFSLPDKTTIDAIKAWAGQCGLDLSAP